jgi:hypothetical protein
MSNEAALQVLYRRHDDQVRKVNALIEVINDLRAEDGLPPMEPIGSGPGRGSQARANGPTQPSQIRPDTFYGKRLQTAVRMYLEMRQAANLGPATPREIYDAVVQGGYQFETKDPAIALVGLRAMLRKRTVAFHKLPNGTYGLTSWYEHPRAPKAPGATAQNQDQPQNADSDSTVTEAEASGTDEASAVA